MKRNFYYFEDAAKYDAALLVEIPEKLFKPVGQILIYAAFSQAINNKF